MGKYFVTPASRETGSGRFQPFFAIQRSAHRSHYCRVFRFEQTFANREAATAYATTQGWLQAGAMPAPACP